MKTSVRAATEKPPSSSASERSAGKKPTGRIEAQCFLQHLVCEGERFCGLEPQAVGGDAVWRDPVWRDSIRLRFEARRRFGNADLRDTTSR